MRVRNGRDSMMTATRSRISTLLGEGVREFVTEETIFESPWLSAERHQKPIEQKANMKAMMRIAGRPLMMAMSRSKHCCNAISWGPSRYGGF